MGETVRVHGPVVIFDQCVSCRNLFCDVDIFDFVYPRANKNILIYFPTRLPDEIYEANGKYTEDGFRKKLA